MDLINLTTEELRQGWHQREKVLFCNRCSFQAVKETEMQEHLEHVHAGNDLINESSKYNHLTKKQKELLVLFSQGKKDKEIAANLGVSFSTIRHQKFTFREKAKQAKLFLATYEQVFAASDPKEQLIELPLDDATKDDRFMITEAEYHELVKKYFTFENNRLELVRWPKGQKKILAVLERVREEIMLEKTYSEKELNLILAPIYFDYVILRRYLVDYGFIKRTADGMQYWRIF